VKNKKGFIVLGAVVVGASLLLGHLLRTNTAQEHDPLAAGVAGIVNPESSKADMATHPLPELSWRTFEPAPSSITGSYTEPAAENAKDTNNAAKKNSGE
jgi:hypothetical protein